MGPGTGLIGTDATGGATVTRPVIVRVTAGPDRGAHRRLDAGTLVVGSSPDADLPLTDGTVSRYHAELALLANGVRVKDLGSTNGTFVGDSRIESIVLQPGSELRVGRTRMELLLADAPLPEAPSELTRFGRLVGASAPMRRVFGQLERAAASNAPTWIFGELGSGKTEAARAIHEASARSAGPLVVLDLDPSTSAAVLARAPESALGGTLVLERLDETTATLQDALLRMLDQRERQGLDIRMVGTSSRDPRMAVEAGHVRRELLFHLAATRIEMPPLRDRLEDLPRLVDAIVQDLGYPEVRLASADLSNLRAKQLPGNVRELRRVIEETLLRSARPRPSRPEVGVATEELSRLPFKEAKEKLLDAFERSYVEEILERAGGNVSRAADEADIDRNHLARLAKKHGLR